MTIRRTTSTALALLGIGLLGCHFAGNASADDDPPPAIQVEGRAELSAPPDLAVFDVRIVSRDANAEKAANDNAKRSRAVMKALKEGVGDAGEIETQGYAVTPQYRWDDGEQILVGHQATNHIRVELRDLDRVGTTTAAALDAGADGIQGLGFSLEDDTALRAQALALAAKRARTKGEAIADALGVKIVRVLQVNEQGGNMRPMPMQAEFVHARGVQAEVPPIEAGPVDVTAQVTLTLEIAD